MRFKSRFYNSQAQGVSGENEQLAQPHGAGQGWP